MPLSIQSSLVVTLVSRLMIRRSGAKRNLAEAAAPAVFEVPGKARVLVFSFAASTSGVPHNWAATDEGPAIFDPAVYYGDRETDLAMTRLFGGFGRNFYRAYESAWPLPPGSGERNTLYQLYHVINHVNLFGGGYGSQAQRMTESLLSELR